MNMYNRIRKRKKNKNRKRVEKEWGLEGGQLKFCIRLLRARLSVLRSFKGIRRKVVVPQTDHLFSGFDLPQKSSRVSPNSSMLLYRVVTEKSVRVQNAKMLRMGTSLRRIARHDEPEFSCASIFNSMERFVKTVNEMEETILIPRRLLDLAVGDAGDTVRLKGGQNVKETLANTDLYRLYNIVNQMKIELLWSKEDRVKSRDDDDVVSDKSLSVYHATDNGTRLGHARCPSTTSMQSIQSASSIASSLSSDSESEAGVENDSGLENEECIDLANSIAENFRHHLRGLHRSINRMTEVAQYLTLRYQVDVDGQI